MKILFRKELFPGVPLQKLQNGYNPVTTPGYLLQSGYKFLTK